MYKVIKSFVDMQDDGHKYNVGDSFPRTGAQASKARISKLASASNRQGTPLIKEVKTDQTLNVAPAPSEKVEQGDAPKAEVDKVPKKNRKNNTRKS